MTNPKLARILALADALDVSCHVKDMTKEYIILAYEVGRGERKTA